MTRPVRDHRWLSRVMAAAFPGTLLIIGIIAVIGRLFHSQGRPNDLLDQYLMWMGALLWIASFSTCFLWRSAARAWCFYVLANLVMWGFFLLAGLWPS
ncbi:hypothetical protein PT277_02230 [Acetobacteraceae bacterium ESL0709]|nr:hypothetical protein [Acetobacteraceae bacterium ESL0697]MDF7677520.1 hypothetical protein [Acetobacteraceae bacterium ESL0709]